MQVNIGFAQHTKKRNFDSSWNRMLLGNNSEYYRLIQKSKDSAGNKIYLVRDFFKSDTLQMQGTYSNLKEEIKEGKFSYYTADGKLEAEENYLHNNRQGDFYYFFKSGKIKSQATYINDTLTKYKRYFEDGNVAAVSDYKSGKLNGKFYSFYPNKMPVRMEVWENGKFKSGKCFTASGADTAYFNYKVNPEFPGGDDKFIDYIYHGIKDNSFSCGWYNGTLQFSAIVTTEGKLEEMHIYRATDVCYYKKIYELIEKSPLWIPAKIDGRPENLRQTFNIYFRYK